ncbi:hypothetical protein ACFLRX_08170 [Acidobacteriota bacterium]
MRKNRILLFILILIILSTRLLSQIENSDSRDQSELEIILKKCAEYCERLDNVSLHFTCNEKITEEILKGSIAFVVKNTHVYDYQLIRKINKILEQRILIEENGRKKNELNAQLKTKRFQHKFIVFGPIGLLGEKQQEVHEYKIVKEVMYKKEKAVIIEAKPRFPEVSDTLYGKIWIRKIDFAILKIEWNQESLENFEEIEIIADKLEAKPKITFISEYGFEKNKIRFPNKYSIEECYIPRFEVDKKLIWSQTTVNYDNYKFFTVETGVKYK